MPEWLQGALTVLGAAAGSYVAVRVELRFVWKYLDALEVRVGRIEGRAFPMRRYTDPRPRVRSD